MTSIVLELQKDALEKNVRTSDLLRKAFVVARKLGINELESWVELELHGYGPNSETPNYRVLPGRIEALNPHHGWQPVIWQNDDMAEAASTRLCQQSIAEIEDLLGQKKSDTGSYQMTLPASLESKIREAISFNTQVAYAISGSSLYGILDGVRNVVLKWALDLEANEILGEDLSFSQSEKNKIERGVLNIQNYFAGDLTAAQIQQNSPHASQHQKIGDIDPAKLKDTIEAIKAKLDDVQLDPDQCREMSADISTISAQIESPNPKQSILKEGVSSIRRILEGASGNVAAQALINLIDAI